MTPLVIWALVAVATLPAGVLAPVGPEAVAMVGAVVGAALLRATPVRMLVTTAGVALLALTGGGSDAWLVAGGGLALAAVGFGPPAAAHTWDDLGRHLAACRRRGSRADVLVARFPGLVVTGAARLAGALRLSDSVALRQNGPELELRAVVDRDGLDRERLEERLRLLCGPDLSCGWAAFPEDGLTLDTLLVHAREATPSATSRASAVRSRAPGAHPLQMGRTP
jgi:hypothetical protein